MTPILPPAGRRLLIADRSPHLTRPLTPDDGTMPYCPGCWLAIAPAADQSERFVERDSFIAGLQLRNRILDGVEVFLVRGEGLQGVAEQIVLGGILPGHHPRADELLNIGWMAVQIRNPKHGLSKHPTSGL